MTHPEKEPDKEVEKNPTKKRAVTHTKSQSTDTQILMKVVSPSRQVNRTTKRKLAKDAENEKSPKSRRYNRYKSSYEEKSGSSDSETSSSEESQHPVSSPGEPFESNLNTPSYDEPDPKVTYPKGNKVRTNIRSPN